MDEMSREQSAKKMRLLTMALIFSGALNIGLMATGLFTKILGSDSKIAISPLNLEGTNLDTGIERCLSEMEKLSFHELVSFLTNRDAVAEGYAKRDLGLAMLVRFHHFHLEKALSFKPPQVREVALGDTKVELFPGLTEDQFEGIIRFAYEEKWPLTGAGLYKLLKKWPDTKDESLVQAFIVTPEFHALQVLFQKSESPQLVSSLIQLITEGPWELVDQFTKEQAQLFDLSVERRRALLLSYMAVGSKTSAKILLESDFAFISKRLEDKGIIAMLSLLTEKTTQAERLCLELLRSPRSDLVWTSAANNLYRYAGENPPNKIDQNEAIARFASALNTKKGLSPQTPATSAPKENIPKNPDKTPKGPERSDETSVSLRHVVKEGESLWKISKQYNVKVDDIVRANQIEKNRLYPGMVLIIP